MIILELPVMFNPIPSDESIHEDDDNCIIDYSTFYIPDDMLIRINPSKNDKNTSMFLGETEEYHLINMTYIEVKKEIDKQLNQNN